MALQLELTTPTRLVVSAEADEVVAPGIEGYFGVLPGHAAFLTMLGTGELTYRERGRERHLAVNGGFAEVRDDTVIVLADTAEWPDEIDRERAERASQRAEQRLAGRAQDDIDFARAEAARARAQVRLQVASRGAG